MSAPNFICIGAPKSGTTWLFDNLSGHPKVWLPPTKSIHYFTGKVNRIRLKKLWRGARGQGLNRGNTRFSFSDDKALTLWKLNYHFWPFPTEQWYLSLFPEEEGKVTGEIAPSYTMLSRGKVAQAHRMVPDAKIIFFMRNPVERAWSHFLLDYVTNRGKNIDQMEIGKLNGILDHPPSVLLSEYLRTIDSWGEYFSKSQIFICFFEEIRETPDELLENLCKFLEIDYEKSFFEEKARRNIFKGANKEMPDAVRAHLSAKFHEQLVELNRRYGSYAERWLRDANRVLGKESVTL